jgi:hypothetical protein
MTAMLMGDRWVARYRSDPDTAIPSKLAEGALEINEASTTFPEVEYSPTLFPFETNRFDPDTAIELGQLSPEIKEALIALPVNALYLPTVPVLVFVTKRSDPDTAIPPKPEPEINDAFASVPSRLYSATPVEVVTNICP